MTHRCKISRSGFFPTKEEKHTTLESENSLTSESISSYVKKRVLRLYPEEQATPTVHVRAYALPKTYKI